MVLYEYEEDREFSRLPFCNLVKDYYGVQIHNWYYRVRSSPGKGCTDTNSQPRTRNKATPLYIKRKID